ncbi:MAG: alpha-galactosidase [Clostridia bacterium]|nr:alpha-galactosidase [Clostridia bacterium]
MKPTTADLKKSRELFYFQDPTLIPVTYKIGDKKYVGIPKEFNPKAERRIIDANIVMYFVTAKTPEGLELRIEYKQYKDFPVFEWTFYITNKSDKNSPQITEFKVFDSVIKGENPVLLHGNGDNFREDGFSWWRDEVKSEPIVKHPLMWDGNSCMGANPYMRLIFDGFLVNIAIGWSAAWQSEISKEEDGARVVIGQKKFNAYLKPNETVRTPSITFLVADGNDEIKIGNLWRSFYFAHIIPRQNGRPLQPKTTFAHRNIGGYVEQTGATEKNQLDALNSMAQRGYKPDIFWIDAGWFPCDKQFAPHTSDYWKSGVGNLYTDPERFPNTMAPIGERCKELGVEFLTWSESERVHINTSTYKEHPEYLLYKKGEPGTWLTDNNLFNLANPEACDWLIDTLDDFIKTNKITIYRQDFNYQPMPYWDENQEENREGILENLHIQGLYRFWDTLVERNPEIWIDNCAMGGRRNDIELMRRSVPLHYTDMAYGKHPIKQAQYRQMFEWIPYFRSSAMAWDQPDGTYKPSYTSLVEEFAFLTVMTAPVFTPRITVDVTDQELEMVIAYRDIWRESAEISLAGDYYPLTLCRRSDEDWYAAQFDDAEHLRGCVHFIRNILCEQEKITVKMHVDKENLNKRYHFVDRFTNEEFDKMGYELNEGFTYSCPKRSGTLMIYTVE